MALMSDDSTQAELTEVDERFVTGEWRGFFLERHTGTHRNWMDLVLSFCEGSVRGDGRDCVGEFGIKGRYDVKSGKVWLDKHYVGRHHVDYKGYADGTNRGIWGIWELGDSSRGGWHIWPAAIGDPTIRRLKAETDVRTDEAVVLVDTA